MATPRRRGLPETGTGRGQLRATPPEDEYLTIAEVAELLMLSPKRVRNLMSPGLFLAGFHFYRRHGHHPSLPPLSRGGLGSGGGPGGRRFHPDGSRPPPVRASPPQAGRLAAMGCTVRANRHGYLAFRLYFDGRESHEGTKLKDTPKNREKVAARARVIAQEIRDGTFDYLHWFPTGNLASQFQPVLSPDGGRSATVRSFFLEWREAESVRRPVSPKWQLNRESYIRIPVLPSLGRTRLADLVPRHLTDLQATLHRRRLAPSTIDRVIHSALRGMLRDADLAGYRVTDLAALFDRRFVEQLDRGRHTADIDPFAEDERDQIISWFREERPHFHAFVYFRFWTGTPPSEAIGLRWRDVDLASRRVKIRRSRVYGTDGQTKTGKSKRDVIIPATLETVLRAHRLGLPAPDEFVFAMPSGAPITEVNFYRREWLPALQAIKVRARPFYNTRHSYITTLLEAGAKPLFVCRQIGTSLAMIESHYGACRTHARELKQLIGGSAAARRRRARPATSRDTTLKPLPGKAP